MGEGAVGRAKGRRYGPSSVALMGPTEPNPIFLGAVEAVLDPPVWPKPRRPIPMPSRSTSLPLRSRPRVAPKGALPGLRGVGAAIFGCSVVVLVDRVWAFAVAVSASGSYPSFSIRSASSFAFFSAASKSMVSATFFAPSFCVFFAPRTLAFRAPTVVAVLRMAEEEIVRGAEGAVCDDSDSEPIRGLLGRAVPLLLVPGFRNGEAVRLITGGV